MHSCKILSVSELINERASLRAFTVLILRNAKHVAPINSDLFAFSRTLSFSLLRLHPLDDRVMCGAWCQSWKAYSLHPLFWRPGAIDVIWGVCTQRIFTFSGLEVKPWGLEDGFFTDLYCFNPHCVSTLDWWWLIFCFSLRSYLVLAYFFCSKNLWYLCNFVQLSLVHYIWYVFCMYLIVCSLLSLLKVEPKKKPESSMKNDTHRKHFIHLWNG